MKFKYFYTALVVLYFSQLFSQNQILIPYRKGNLWGYADTTGKVLIEPQFLKPVFFKEGLAIVGTESGVGLINHVGNYLIQPEYDSIAMLSNSNCLISSEGKWGLMSISGNLLVPLNYNYWMPYLSDYSYSNSESNFSIYGFVNDSIRDFYRIDSKNNSVKVLSVSVESEVSYNSAKMIFNVNLNDSVYKYDINGLLMQQTKAQYQEFVEIQVEKFEPVTFDKPYKKQYPTTTYFHSQKKVGLVYEYQLIENRQFVVYKDSIPADYDTIVMYGLNVGLYKVKKKNKWGLVDAKNKVVVPCVFEDLELHRSKIFKTSNQPSYFYLYLKIKSGWDIYRVDIHESEYNLIQMTKDKLTSIKPFANNEFLCITQKGSNYGAYYLHQGKYFLNITYNFISNEISTESGFLIFKIKSITGEDLYVGYNGVHFFEGFEY